VSIDEPGAETKIRDFAREFGLTFQILYDPSGAMENEYQTTGVPETFVIARDGVIRKKVIGASDWNSDGNRALIAQLLAERGR
jgi:peroxiredoxin